MDSHVRPGSDSSLLIGATRRTAAFAISASPFCTWYASTQDAQNSEGRLPRSLRPRRHAVATGLQLRKLAHDLGTGSGAIVSDDVLDGLHALVVARVPVI